MGPRKSCYYDLQTHYITLGLESMEHVEVHVGVASEWIATKEKQKHPLRKQAQTRIKRTGKNPFFHATYKAAGYS